MGMASARGRKTDISENKTTQRAYSRTHASSATLAATPLLDSATSLGAEVNTLVSSHLTINECVLLPAVPLLEQGMP